MTSHDSEDWPGFPQPLNGAVPHYLFHFPQLHAVSDNDALTASPRAATAIFGGNSSPPPSSLPASLPAPRPQTSTGPSKHPFTAGLSPVTSKDASSSDALQKRLSDTYGDAPIEPRLRPSRSPTCSPRPTSTESVCGSPPLAHTRLSTSPSRSRTTTATTTTAMATATDSTGSPSTSTAVGSPGGSSEGTHPCVPLLTVEPLPPTALLDDSALALALAGPETSIESPHFAVPRRRGKRTSSPPKVAVSKDHADAPATTETEPQQATEPAPDVLVITSLGAGEMPSMNPAAEGDAVDVNGGSLRYQLPRRQRHCGAAPPSLAALHCHVHTPPSAAADDDAVVLGDSSPLASETSASSSSHPQRPQQPHSQAAPPSTVAETVLQSLSSSDGARPRLNSPPQPESTGPAAAVTAAVVPSSAALRRTRARGGSELHGSSNHGEDCLSTTQQSTEALSTMVLDSLVTMAAFAPIPSSVSPHGSGTHGAPRAPADADDSTTSSTGISAFAKAYLGHLAGFSGWQGVGVGLPTPSAQTDAPARSCTPLQQTSPQLGEDTSRPVSRSPSSPPPLAHNNTTAMPQPSSPFSVTSPTQTSEVWSPSLCRESGGAPRLVRVIDVEPRTTPPPPPLADLPSPKGTPRRMPSAAVQAPESAARTEPRHTKLSPPMPRHTLLPSEGTPRSTDVSPFPTDVAPLTLAHFERTSPSQNSPAIFSLTSHETPPANNIVKSHIDSDDVTQPRPKRVEDTVRSQSRDDSTLRTSPVVLAQHASFRIDGPGHGGASFPSAWHTNSAFTSSETTTTTPTASTSLKSTRPTTTQSHGQIGPPLPDARRASLKDWSLHSKSLQLSLMSSLTRRRGSGHEMMREASVDSFFDANSPTMASGRRGSMSEAVKKRLAAHATNMSPSMHRRRSQSQPCLIAPPVPRFPSPLSRSQSCAAADGAVNSPVSHGSSVCLAYSLISGSTAHAMSPHFREAARRDTAAPRPAIVTSNEASTTRTSSVESETAQAPASRHSESESVTGAARVQRYAVSSLTLGTLSEAPATSLYAFPTSFTPVHDSSQVFSDNN